MRPAVDAFQEDDIHFFEQGVNRIDDLDAILLLDFLGVARDPVPTFRNVAAAAGIGGDDPYFCEYPFHLGTVQQAGEGDDVRSIQADDPGLELLARLLPRRGKRHRHDEKGYSKRRGEKEVPHGRILWRGWIGLRQGYPSEGSKLGLTNSLGAKCHAMR